jgi:hypothetical protein
VEIIKRSAADPAESDAVDDVAAEGDTAPENMTEGSEAEMTGVQDDNN